MKLETVVVSSPAEAASAYQDGRCTGISSDVSQLHSERLENGKTRRSSRAAGHYLEQAARTCGLCQEDSKWFNVVKWINFARC